MGMTGIQESLAGPRLTQTSLKTNPSVFRYWQRIVTTVREVVRFRTPIGSYLDTGFYEEAFQRGFELTDLKDVEVELKELNARLVPTAIQNMMEKLIKAKGASRFHAYCVLIYFKFENSTEKQFHWLEPRFITTLKVEEGTRKITALSFNPPIFSDDAQSVLPVTLSKGQLENAMLIGNYSEVIGRYRAWIDPIVDDLIGLANTNQQTALRTIRISSGQRYVIAPQSIVGNPESQRKLEKFLANFGQNSLFIAPEGSFTADGKTRFEFGLKFGEGSLPSNPKDDRDIHLESVSAYTKIPREIFIGAEIGLRSAETNRQGFLNQVSLAQRLSDQQILWMLSRIVADSDEPTDESTDLSETHKVRWLPFVEVDETEKTTLEIQRFDSMLRLLPAMDKLGWDQQLVQDKLGIDIKIDESMKQTAKEEAEALRDSMMEKSTGLSEDESNDDSDDDKPKPTKPEVPPK